MIDDWSHWGQQDVALAAFLMLLWKDMYPAREVRADEDKPWDTWGRPSSGFVDLGCVSNFNVSESEVLKDLSG